MTSTQTNAEEAYDELFNNSMNDLSQELSTLVEKRAEELVKKGLKKDDAYMLCYDALDNAAGSWNDEGQAIVKKFKRERKRK